MNQQQHASSQMKIYLALFIACNSTRERCYNGWIRKISCYYWRWGKKEFVHWFFCNATFRILWLASFSPELDIELSRARISSLWSKVLRLTFSSHFNNFALETEIPVIEDAFRSYTSRNDVGIILINQHVSYAYFYRKYLTYCRLPMISVTCWEITTRPSQQFSKSPLKISHMTLTKIRSCSA